MKNADEQWKRRWLDSRLSLDRYHPDVSVLEEAIWKFCLGIATSPNRGNRLILYGTNGNGKSRCAKAVLRWLRDRAIDLPLVMGEEAPSLIDYLMVNWAERVDSMKQGAWEIEDMINATILIIDDIGAEHDPSKVGIEKLYLLLERRERKWTLITTNSPPDQWEFKFERRVADRLFRNCTHVDLSRLPSYSTQ